MKTVSRLTFAALAALSAGYAQPLITTVAGNGTMGFSGDGGPATKAGIGIPPDIAVDGAGKPGEVIILWATGFGPTSPAPPTGGAVPSDKAYPTSLPPSITIDNVPATVYGAALAPGSAGLYQIAIQVPPSLADGDWPIQALIAGVQSPVGTILSVHH